MGAKTVRRGTARQTTFKRVCWTYQDLNWERTGESRSVYVESHRVESRESVKREAEHETMLIHAVT